MRLFSSRLYDFQFLGDEQNAWANLKINTKESASLTSVKTDKKFIGIVYPGYFKVISSVVGKGAFCTLEGKKAEMEALGYIQIEIHKAFRILMIIWLFLVFGGVLYLLLANGVFSSLKAIGIILIILFILRYFLLNYLFNTVSQNSIEEIREIMNIELQERI